MNVACRDYLQELDKIKNKVSDITAEFSVKLLKMNKSNIVQGLEKNEINIESLKLNNKNPDELIAIFNSLGHYSFLGSTLDNTINGVIPTIVRYLDMSTDENQVMNYLYANLHSLLSNEQIKNIFDNIKNKKISLENIYVRPYVKH